MKVATAECHDCERNIQPDTEGSVATRPADHKPVWLCQSCAHRVKQARRKKFAQVLAGLVVAGAIGYAIGQASERVEARRAERLMEERFAEVLADQQETILNFCDELMREGTEDRCRFAFEDWVDRENEADYRARLGEGLAP